MNSVRLFLRYWEECYNPDKEEFLEALVWVRLFSLLDELSEPNILEGIGNVIGQFMKVLDIAKRQWHVAYTYISVHMNISQPLPKAIELVYHDSIWLQSLDYEHVPLNVIVVKNTTTYSLIAPLP